MRPLDSTVAGFDEWVQTLQREHPTAHVSWNAERDILTVNLPATQMGQLLGHEVRRYTHVSGASAMRVSASSAQLLGRAKGHSALASSLSESLRSAVSYIAGVTQFPLQVRIMIPTKPAHYGYLPRTAVD